MSWTRCVDGSSTICPGASRLTRRSGGQDRADPFALSCWVSRPRGYMFARGPSPAQTLITVSYEKIPFSLSLHQVLVLLEEESDSFAHLTIPL